MIPTPRWLVWVVESAGMIPVEVWQGFTLIAAMLIMNYSYPDMLMLF